MQFPLNFINLGQGISLQFLEISLPKLIKFNGRKLHWKLMQVQEH
jgi:hypothetical protein